MPDKPCPYCKSDKIFVKSLSKDGNTVCQIFCVECGSRGPIGKNIKEARRLWNAISNPL